MLCSYHKIIIIIKKKRQEETLGDDRYVYSIDCGNDGYVHSINFGDDFTDAYLPPN